MQAMYRIVRLTGLIPDSKDTPWLGYTPRHSIPRPRIKFTKERFMDVLGTFHAIIEIPGVVMVIH